MKILLIVKFYKTRRHFSDTVAIFLTDDITEKVPKSCKMVKNPIRQRKQMLITNRFYPIKASDFGKDGRIIKSEQLGSRKEQEGIFTFRYLPEYC